MTAEKLILIARHVMVVHGETVVVCGKCNREAHVGCLGLQAADIETMEDDWLCTGFARVC